MDITKLLNSKKEDLSNNSNTEEDAKRKREKRVLTCHRQILPKHLGIFLKRVSSRKIVLNCLRNLEKEVKNIHKLALSNKNNQIKDDKQLADLSES